MTINYSENIQYGRDLITLSNLSKLTVREVVEIIQWIPWDIKTILRYYSIWGEFPDG